MYLGEDAKKRHDISDSLEPQIFGSKKYNDFGNTFVNTVHNLAFGKTRDLPNDKTFFFDKSGAITPFVQKITFCTTHSIML